MIRARREAIAYQMGRCDPVQGPSCRFWLAPFLRRNAETAPERNGIMSDKGIGASVRRKEDARFVRGRGTYVADMVRPAMLFGAFVRSPHAHAAINGLRRPSSSSAWSRSRLPRRASTRQSSGGGT
jgi:hypothetical protein